MKSSLIRDCRSTAAILEEFFEVFRVPQKRRSKRIIDQIVDVLLPQFLENIFNSAERMW